MSGTHAVKTGRELALGTVRAVVSVNDTLRFGDVLAKSGFFDDARSAAQAVVKVLAGGELGIPPIASMTGVYIVKGRVCLSANLMAALVQRADRYDYEVVEHTARKCRLAFFGNKRGQWTPLGESEFTMEHADQAGLLSGPNRHSWEKYPRNMLYARAMSNGVKWYCPGLFGGPLYTPDELDAVIDGETGEVVGYAFGRDEATTATPEVLDRYFSLLKHARNELGFTDEQLQDVMLGNDFTMDAVIEKGKALRAMIDQAEADKEPDGELESGETDDPSDSETAAAAASNEVPTVPSPFPATLTDFAVAAHDAWPDVYPNESAVKLALKDADYATWGAAKKDGEAAWRALAEFAASLPRPVAAEPRPVDATG